MSAISTNASGSGCEMIWPVKEMKLNDGCEIDPINDMRLQLYG